MIPQDHGMAICIRAPMGEAGLEGYTAKEWYHFRYVGKAESPDGEPYYRIYPAGMESRHEVCGVKVFDRYFRIEEGSGSEAWKAGAYKGDGGTTHKADGGGSHAPGEQHFEHRGTNRHVRAVSNLGEGDEGGGAEAVKAARHSESDGKKYFQQSSWHPLTAIKVCYIFNLSQGAIQPRNRSTKMVKQISKFQKGSGVFVCRICNRSTRAVQCGSAALIELCQSCYDVEGERNQHSDDGHEGELEECKICRPPKFGMPPPFVPQVPR